MERKDQGRDHWPDGLHIPCSLDGQAGEELRDAPTGCLQKQREGRRLGSRDLDTRQAAILDPLLQPLLVPGQHQINFYWLRRPRTLVYNMGRRSCGPQAHLLSGQAQLQPFSTHNWWKRPRVPRHQALLLLPAWPGLPASQSSGQRLLPQPASQSLLADTRLRLWPEPGVEQSPGPFSDPGAASWKDHRVSLPLSTFEWRKEGLFSPAASGTWLSVLGASVGGPSMWPLSVWLTPIPGSLQGGWWAGGRARRHQSDPA